MGDFNARVGKFQNVEKFEENAVERCLLRDSKDCVMSDYGKLDCLKWYKSFSTDYAFMKTCDLSM